MTASSTCRRCRTQHGIGGTKGTNHLLALASVAAGTLVSFAEAPFSPVTMAVPAFARKTGLSCSACHGGWSRLNDFGQLFRIAVIA